MVGSDSMVGSGAYSEDAREGDPKWLPACERGVAGTERAAADAAGEDGTMSGRGEGGTAVSICRTPPSMDAAHPGGALSRSRCASRQSLALSQRHALGGRALFGGVA